MLQGRGPEAEHRGPPPQQSCQVGEGEGSGWGARIPISELDGITDRNSKNAVMEETVSGRDRTIEGIQGWKG